MLLDSGSTVSMIERSVIPIGAITKDTGESKSIRSVAGQLKTQDVITMQDIRLPEFDKNMQINVQKVLVFDNDKVKYHITLGTNFLSNAGIKLNYSTGATEWFDCSTPLRPPGGTDAREFDAMEDMLHIQVEVELLGHDWLQSFATTILDAKYEWTDETEVVDKLTHLNMHQKADLLQVLCKNEMMFDGTLGVYPQKKVHIDIDPDAKPVHARP